ncbi:MAG: carbohydrate ABC transporter permease [Armatimonadota bacterium]
MSQDIQHRKYVGAIERRNQRNGILFCLPSIIGLALFTAFPILASFYFSFCNYDGLNPAKWIGPANYERLLTDPLVKVSLYNTFYYAIIAVPLGIVVAYILALLLNQKVRGMALFRTLFFLPSIVPTVASSVLWLWILNPQYGLINAIIEKVTHHAGPGWMSDPNLAKWGLIMMSTWGVGGSMLIFLAGLQNVPQDLLDAAEVDGASAWYKLWHVTIPMTSPQIFFNLIMGMIASLQYFTQAFVMSGGMGTPADSTLFFALYLFKNAFMDFKMGYASAMAWLLFVVTLALTLGIFKSTDKHVYYGGGR